MSAHGCTCTAIYEGRGIACERPYHRDTGGKLRGKCTALVDGVGYVEWDDENRSAVVQNKESEK